MKSRPYLVPVLGLLAGVGIAGSAAAACTAPISLPAASASNSVTFGDGISYSLPILGLNVQSAPGQIDDCIVVATGTNNVGVNTNLAGMDNAYQTPNGTSSTSTFFRTGDPTDAPDPDEVAAFAGDTATTWDTTLAALKGFLGANDMVVYFNHNQTDAGIIDQDLAIWAQLRLWNVATGASEYFYFTSVPNATGLTNFGQPGGDPFAYTGPQAAATSTYPTGADSAATFPQGGIGTGTGSGDASFMVRALGQVCLDGPVGSGQPIPCSDPGVVTTINHNLGQNNAANAVVFPEINAILNTAGFNGFTNLSVDLRMGCNAAQITGGSCPEGFPINNGYEQVFISALQVTQIPVPEPSLLALLGIGLLGLASRRRRR